jgi:GNAT superfamily N-acetyltransferase
MTHAPQLAYPKPIMITEARSPAEIAHVRELFLEYANSLGFSLCFQSFDKELAGLPGKYAPPDGKLLIAHCDKKPAGCVALHKLGDGVCEMKRLYVRREFRGSGLGAALAHAIITAARELGYSCMRLDTVPSVMGSAVKIYCGLGFREIAPYTHNPVEGAIFLELEL